MDPGDRQDAGLRLLQRVAGAGIADRRSCIFTSAATRAKLLATRWLTSRSSSSAWSRDSAHLALGPFLGAPQFLLGERMLDRGGEKLAGTVLRCPSKRNRQRRP